MNAERIPDLDRIRGLEALDVALRLNLIHRDVAKPRADRWAWRSSTQVCYLSFRGGAYYDHKLGCGGGAIDLVMQSDDPDSPPSQSRFRDAVHRIACAYNLWRDFGPMRGRAEALSAELTPEIVEGQLLTPATNIPQALEARRLLEALGLQWSRTTFAIHRANVGFSPAVPWQGAKISRKPDGEYGGWTRDRAKNHMRDAFALRIVCVDLDGADGIAPRIDLTERLIRDLSKREMTPRAVVLSSWADDGRAKFHLYFVAKAKARDEAEYLSWHQVAWDRIEEVVKYWAIEDAEVKAFTPDPAAAAIHRLMRLTGYDKFGAASRGHAATLYQEPDRSAVVDFTALSERQNLTIMALNDDNEGKVYRFGERVNVEEHKVNDKTGEMETRTHDAASHVYPLSLYRQAETDEHGIRFLYRSSNNSWRYGTLPLSACAERAAGRRLGAKAADAGVVFAPRGVDTFTLALGHWAERKRRAGEVDYVNLVRTPGWHRSGADGWVYVNGPHIHGAGGWYADTEDPRIKVRSHRGGDLDSWKAAIRQHATGPFITLALGYSLAGPLCEWLGIGSTILHIAGESSSGKSTAARLASSVWGDPARTERTWNSTLNGFELMAEEFSGACLWIDELQNFGGDAASIGRHIHAITSGVGRTRATRTGDPASVRSWSCTVISTGETTIQERAGDHWQGGHGVRALDLALEPGERVTQSAEHADAIDSIVAEHHGHASDAWIRHLLATGRDRVRETYEQWRGRAELLIPSDAGIEVRRVMTRAVSAFAALDEAREAGLTFWSVKDLEDALSWLVERICRQRAEEGSRNPCERAYAVLCAWYDSDPGRFPGPQERDRARDIVGLSPTGPQEGDWIYTKPSMLKRAGFYSTCAVSAKHMTHYLATRGLLFQERGGVPGHNRSRGRWLRIRVSEPYEAHHGVEQPSEPLPY